MPIDPNIPLTFRSPQIQDPMESLGKVLSLKSLMDQQRLQPMHEEAARLQLEQQRMDMQDVKTMREQFPLLLQKHGGDYEKALTDLSTMINPKTALTIRSTVLGNAEKLANIQKTNADAETARGRADEAERDFYGHVALRVQRNGYNPAAFDAALLQAEGATPRYKDHIEQIRQAVAANPDQIKSIVDDLVSKSQGATKEAREASIADFDLKGKKTTAITSALELAGRTVDDPALKDQPSWDRWRAGFDADVQPYIPAQFSNESRARVRRGAVPVKEQPEFDIHSASAAALQSMTPADWDKAIADTVPDATSPLYQRTAAAVRLALGRGDVKAAQAAIKDAGDQLGRTESAVATAKATAPIKIDIAGAVAAAKADEAGLTDDDYKRAGEQYQRTGIMPSVGRDSVTRGKIVHAGNQWARDNGLSAQDVVIMQAAYAGDKDSLKKFQASRDQIVSFEATAQKNLQLMIDAGKKLLDSGSPLLNKPLRTISRKTLGSDDQAAFDAAMLIANNEVAKVTSGGGLGGVVSDSARHEMKEAMGTAPTIGNMIAVAKILQKDMENRHQSMDATLGDIKTRIGGGSGATGGSGDTTPPIPAKLSGGDLGKVYLYNGKRVKITDVNVQDPTKFKWVEAK